MKCDLCGEKSIKNHYITRSTRQIPKAQREVWEWKQTLYEEIKNMNFFV